MNEETDLFLEIKIGYTLQPDSPGVSIRWKNSPDILQEFDAADQAYTKICDGIHNLLSNLGPIVGEGWVVEFTCKDYNLIVEPDLSREDYNDRNRL